MTLLKISALIFLIIVPVFVFAQRSLEVPLPGLETSQLPLLSDYVKYIFNFSIGISGFIVFAVLIYGGFRYLTSAGNPSVMSDAKDRIFSALLGLVVLLGSYLILTTINPQLITISLKLTPGGLVAGNLPGVYLCKDDAAQDCQLFTSSRSKLDAFDNQVRKIKFVNTPGTQYGLVLHGNPDFTGNCAICTSENCSAEIPKVGGVSSITLFVQANPVDPLPGPGATLYECSNYDTASKTGGVLGIKAHQCQSWGPFQNRLAVNIGKEGKSIKIEKSRKWLVVLFEKADGLGECGIFTQSVPNLAASSRISVCIGFGLCANFKNMESFGSVSAMPIAFPL